MGSSLHIFIILIFVMMSGTDYRILSTKKIMINYIISGDIAKPDGYFFLKPNIFSDITFLR
jgi:hypothetical protein